MARIFLGRRLASAENENRKLGVIAGVPAVGLDALASSAYGPEAALAILAPAGAAGLGYLAPIAAVILAVLAALYFSYRQTISAYPTGGGSYTVARSNLGVHAGLLAAAALTLDYTLNVAVAISAGVAALVSALPMLHPYTLPLCLLVLAAVALVNLRGTVESGWTFALPTYLFVACFAAVLGLGVFRVWALGDRRPVVTPPVLPGAAGAVGLWLVLRAFASGCTAMTGVEAVSNGVTAFKPPPEVVAKRTLTVIVLILAGLLVGIVLLCRAYGVGAVDQHSAGYQSVLSQLVGAVVGRGPVYFVSMASLLAVLALSANTSFVDFPRLCHALAADGFLPKAFALAGQRLVYSMGIVFLSAAAGLLLIVFGGITDRLIPLFAVGAFLAFTLSQAGMVVHWRRDKDTRRWVARSHLLINAAGAGATGAALVVILVAKFVQGAWITALAIPALMRLFLRVHAHYRRLDRRLAARHRLELSGSEPPPVVVLPIQNWDRLASKALRFAMRLSPMVVALHLGGLDDPATGPASADLRRRWRLDVEDPAREAGVPVPELVILRTPYRLLLDPIIGFVQRLEQRHPGRLITVVIPELTTRSWWQAVLHQRRGDRLRAALLKLGDPRVVVATVPWVISD